MTDTQKSEVPAKKEHRPRPVPTQPLIPYHLRPIFRKWMAGAIDEQTFKTLCRQAELEARARK